MARQFKVLREGGTEDGNINSQIRELQQEVAAKNGKDFCVGDPGFAAVSGASGYFYTYVAVTCSWEDDTHEFTER